MTDRCKVGNQPADISLIHRRSRNRLVSHHPRAACHENLKKVLDKSDHISPNFDR